MHADNGNRPSVMRSTSPWRRRCSATRPSSSWARRSLVTTAHTRYVVVVSTLWPFLGICEKPTDISRKVTKGLLDKFGEDRVIDVSVHTLLASISIAYCPSRPPSPRLALPVSLSAPVLLASAPFASSVSYFG